MLITSKCFDHPLGSPGLMTQSTLEGLQKVKRDEVSLTMGCKDVPQIRGHSRKSTYDTSNESPYWTCNMPLLDLVGEADLMGERQSLK